MSRIFHGLVLAFTVIANLSISSEILAAEPDPYGIIIKPIPEKTEER